MTLPLTPEVLGAAYDFLRTTEPFRRWNLPESEDVQFRVVRDFATRGFYRRDQKDRPSISISSNCNGHTDSLIGTMAHEMVHLHEDVNCLETKGEHSRAWHKYADRVCAVHGFDRKMF